ncbi:MAG: rRNA maturation RNase YbeY [Omnitrophica bacterium RIFCSPHIGHO2_02_FULL_51_18]|nr:MAG: rRNA maturation RNase YbeY [Omnitrophica bacterium RIFCSPHIGHO2_02_FULL_51_18]
MKQKQGFGVSVLLTDDREIRKINKRFLNHNYATDVIAFGLDEEPLLGDIVVSVERARAVAKELGIPFKEELARYLVHGMLHLLGYEDKPKKKYDRMHKRQEKILDVILRRSRRISKRDPSSLRSSG